MEAGRTGGLTVRPSARSGLLWLGLAVTLVLTYLALRDAQLGDVWAALRESDKIWLVPALAVLAAAVATRAVRWRSLFPPSDRPPLREVARALLIGYFYNNLLPLRAGEAARIVVLHRRTGVAPAQTIATVVVERAYDVLALLLLLFAIVPRLPDVEWLRPAAVLLVAVGVGLLGCAALLARFGTRPLAFLLRPFGWFRFFPRERLERATVSLGEGLIGLRNARMAAIAFGWTVLSWILVALSAWLVMVSFDLGLSPLAGLLVVIAINLALILPSSPGAIGIFEAATVIALDAYGVPRSEALSYALVLHALNFVPFVVAGLVLHAQAAVGRTS